LSNPEFIYEFIKNWLKFDKKGGEVSDFKMSGKKGRNLLFVIIIRRCFSVHPKKG